MYVKYDFLDLSANLIVNDLRMKHADLYMLVFKILKLVNNIKDDEECNKFINDREKYIVTTLYDCYATFSSEVLLLERGLVSDYCILLRSFYEKKFKFFAVIKNKRNYKRVIDEHEYYSLDLAKRIIANKNHIFDDFVDKINPSDYNFDSYEKKKQSVETFANNAGLISEYERQYSILSEKTHFGIGSLAEKLETGNDNIKYSLFSFKSFDNDLYIACYEMVNCIKKFLDYKECKKFASIITEIDKLFSEIGKKSIKL